MPHRYLGTRGHSLQVFSPRNCELEGELEPESRSRSQHVGAVFLPHDHELEDELEFELEKHVPSHLIQQVLPLGPPLLGDARY